MTDPISDEAVPERPSARLLIIDPSTSALLLLGVNDPNLSAHAGTGCACWVTVGGGVDPGETFEETAIRELWEETGLVAGRDARIGSVIAERRLVIPFGSGADRRNLLSVERYFAVELLVAPGQVADSHLLPYERGFIEIYAWWTPQAMRAAVAAGTDRFFPDALPEYVDGILDNLSRNNLQ